MTIAGGSALSSMTGAVLTEGNAAYAPLCLMLLSSVIALFAASYVRVLDRHEEYRC
jgi:DHA1 family bicyclomycin/chloramphenicol resistance-like MFS transporter